MAVRGRVDVGAPADDGLAVVEQHAVEDAPGAADAALVRLAHDREAPRVRLRLLVCLRGSDEPRTWRYDAVVVVAVVLTRRVAVDVVAEVAAAHTRRPTRLRLRSMSRASAYCRPTTGSALAARAS